MKKKGHAIATGSLFEDRGWGVDISRGDGFESRTAVCLLIGERSWADKRKVAKRRAVG